ncbi:M43 family zinc metalloprotease [Crocinitomix catalasitica]|uniref:M43 family zinc metalloprotease n=1 Tax=Crocinitomix catalasitica TaxID=184607 RepID=UPI000487AB81|nr:M43 family zinc metalloprotease [Crocinitomix catalasitica]
MKININVKILLLLIFTSTWSQAQEEFSCGIAEKLKLVYEAYPGLEQDQQELLERSKTGGLRSGDRDGVYTIPVVFHIIHENGVENISDEQVYDQMAILNRDYRKLNADTVEIMEEFKAIASDARIEFRLANKDLYGECTNGIEHIYSYETNNGDNYSKLNQWPRSRYLNIWVVNSMEDGVAGYAYYPSAVSGALAYADGIIIRHNFIGSIGTSSEYSSRALTHEIGHWLGLPHTWGSTNSPEVSCGDDGVEDTPETAGHTSCVLEDTDNCNTGIEENIQNYMEYAYCSRMFTEGQIAVMTTSLENVISSRNNLYTDLNKENGGIDRDPVLCTPLPSFYSDKNSTCKGGDIQFFSSSSRAEVDRYAWSFPGGIPSSSTEMSPVVNYAEVGNYAVTLTVTNAAGTETLVKESFVNILPDYWQHEGPFNEDFETTELGYDSWVIENPNENENVWAITENAAYSGDKSMGVQYYKASPDPILEPHYYERLGGQVDAFITPAYNLERTSDAFFSFKYSYATTNAGVYEPQVELNISYQTNCDGAWRRLTDLEGDEVECLGYIGTSFKPNRADDWTTFSIALPGAADGPNTRFRFELVAEDGMNNFYIDDINVSGVLSNGDLNESIQNMSVYPNPIADNKALNLSFYSVDNESASVRITNVMGQEVFQTSIATIAGLNTNVLPIGDARIAAGVYNITIQKGSSLRTARLIIQ